MADKIATDFISKIKAKSKIKKIFFSEKGPINKTVNPKNKDTNKYLPRRAKLYGNLGINYYIQEWIFGIEQIGSGSRYDDKANNNKIEGYMITNLIANFALNEKTTINFRLDNAFDKAYALAYEGSQSSSTGYIYQTPGRSLYTNLRYDF